MVHYFAVSRHQTVDTLCGFKGVDMVSNKNLGSLWCFNNQLACLLWMNDFMFESV